MSNDNQLILILQKIAEVSEQTARIEERQLALRDDIIDIKEEDRRQNKLLDEHIQGTITNRARLEVEIKNRKDLETHTEIMEMRLQQLEAIPKFLKTSKKIAAYVAGFCSAVYAIYELFK